MAGLFDTFTVAKRGLFVQQGNINTTSHNIANVQTPGYSRQRANVVTTTPFGGMSKYDGCGYGQIGTGAQINQINRIRNEFIDYQVRTETTNQGTLDSTYQYLYKVEDILNETTSTGIQGALNEFYNAFQELSKAPEKDSNRTVALKKAEALAIAINSRYNQLESKKEDAQKELANQINDINKILDQINELNKQISRVSAIGMQPNDLLDSRDYLIDQLSSKFGVKIDKDKNNTIDLKTTEGGVNNKLQNLVNSDPNNSNYTRFSYVQNAEITDGKLVVTYNVLGDKNKTNTFTITSSNMNDLQDLKAQLLQDRVLIGNEDGIVCKINGDGKQIPLSDGEVITSAQFKGSIFNKEQSEITKGALAGTQEVQDTIQGYMDELDKFAASFAYAVNAIQTGSYEDEKTNIEGVTDAPLIFVVRQQDGTLTTSDTGITAKNITLNTVLEEHLDLLNCGEKKVDDISGSKDGSRALAIAQIANLKINIGSLKASDIADRKTFFNKAGISFADSKNMTLKSLDTSGTKLSEYYGSTISKLAAATATAKTALSTQEILLTNLENQRLSESGVSLDEEMANLIQFQHSYQANAKMISTVDELLDVVINGLKR